MTPPTTLKDLLNKRVSRKQFLLTLGLGVVSIFGFSTLLHFITGKQIPSHISTSSHTPSKTSKRPAVATSNSNTSNTTGQSASSSGSSASSSQSSGLSTNINNSSTTSEKSTVVLDTTASDIAPLGTQGAGSVGKAADAGHIHQLPRLDQVAAPTADVSLNNEKLTNVASPTNASDAANKQYVDMQLGLTIALG